MKREPNGSWMGWFLLYGLLAALTLAVIPPAEAKPDKSQGKGSSKGQEAASNKGPSQHRAPHRSNSRNQEFSQNRNQNNRRHDAGRAGSRFRGADSQRRHRRDNQRLTRERRQQSFRRQHRKEGASEFRKNTSREQQREYREEEKDLRHIFRSQKRRDNATARHRVNERVLQRFDATVQELRQKHRKNRKNHDREMLDPYGHSKDDRKEIYGNRGRPVRSQPPQEPPVEEPPLEQPPVVEQPPAEEPPADEPPVEEPPVVEQPPVEEPPEETYVTVTSSTFEVLKLSEWNSVAVTTSLLTEQGYTSTEIDFLLSASLDEISQALQSGGQLLIS